MSDRPSLEYVCERILTNDLGLDWVNVVHSQSCYYHQTDNFIAMNAKDACSYETEWYETVEQLLPQAREYNLILWALLHEYGHSQDTMESWTDEDDTFCRALMNMMPDGRDRVLAYFSLPSERVATEWAADFIRNNKDKCKVANAKLEEYVC